MNHEVTKDDVARRPVRSVLASQSERLGVKRLIMITDPTTRQVRFQVQIDTGRLHTTDAPDLDAAIDQYNNTEVT